MNKYIKQIIESLDFVKIESARINYCCEQLEDLVELLSKYYKMDNEVLNDLSNISKVFKEIAQTSNKLDETAQELRLSWLLEINSLKGDEINTKENY